MPVRAAGKVAGMNMLKSINLGLAFVLELALLVALGVWAFAVWPDSWWRFALAIVAIGAAVVLWAIWAAPRSAARLQGPWLLLFKIAIFGVGVAALVMARQPLWAGLFGALVAANLALALAWGQE